MINPVKHKNLLHWFKRESVSAEKINKYLKAYPQTERTVGALPYDWIKSFPENERSKVTQLVQDTFTSFAKDTGAVRGISRVSGWSRVDVQKFASGYEILVNNLKKILKRDDIVINHAGSGALKNCHRLDVGEYSYALSGFRAPNATKEGFEGYFKTGHGRGYEPQNAVTAYKKGAHGRWAKPFMIRLSDKEDEGGFILSKFIDKRKKAPFGFLQKLGDYFVNLDEADDVINNINTDIGGCIVNKNFLKDSTIRYMRNYFAKMLDNNTVWTQKLYSDEVQVFLIEQKQKGVDILSDNFIKNLPFSGSEKKNALTVLKSLKKLRKQKDELIIRNQNKFDEIKELLQKDLNTTYNFERHKENAAEFIRKAMYFPQLAADEIGLSNNVLLDSWLNLYHEYGKVVDLKSLKKNFTQKDILKFLDEHYVNIRYSDDLVNKFAKTFGIENEIKILEENFQKSAAGKQEEGWDSFLEFMNRSRN